MFAPGLIVVSRATAKGLENAFKVMRVLQSNVLLDAGDTRRPHVFFVFVDRNRCASHVHLRCGEDICEVSRTDITTGDCRNNHLSKARTANQNFKEIITWMVAWVPGGTAGKIMKMSRESLGPSLALASASAVLFCCLLFSNVALSRSAPRAGSAIDADKSSPLNPVLIELFTSEGCSSCPPADILLKKLDASQPIPGALLIVLSEHVTYWDQDGWRDPNSSSSLTERQNSYEEALGEKTPYTPQLIVDGTHIMRAENPKQIEDTLQKAATTPKLLVRIANVTVDAGIPTLLRAHVETAANLEKHGADVYLAVALDHVESQVLRGENGGRHLLHVAVVQEIVKIGKLPKGQSFAQDVQLKLKPGTDPKNVRLIALVQESGPGKVLGAALRRPAS
jgi:hypothetical protein